MQKSNPIEHLLKKGVTRKEMSLKTGRSLPEISMVLRGSRKGSLGFRKAFYDTYAVNPWDWD